MCVHARIGLIHRGGPRTKEILEKVISTNKNSISTLRVFTFTSKWRCKWRNLCKFTTFQLTDHSAVYSQNRHIGGTPGRSMWWLNITLLVSTLLFLGLFLGEWLTLWLKGTFIGKRKTITNDISMAVPTTNYQLTGLIWQCMIWQVHIHMKGENIYLNLRSLEY